MCKRPTEELKWNTKKYLSKSKVGKKRRTTTSNNKIDGTKKKREQNYTYIYQSLYLM